MRYAVSLVTLLLVLSAIAFAQSANSASDRAGVQQVSVSQGESTITGCLAGHPDEYRLTDKNGTMHLLMGPNDVLGKHVGQMVELIGYRDNNRDASASSDEGTAHGMRFFQVEDIVPESGSCK
jgi:hypothetical protein